MHMAATEDTREPLVGLAERLRHSAGRINMRQTEARPLMIEAATALEEHSRRVEERDVLLREIYEWMNDHPPIGTHGTLAMMRKIRTALSPSDTVEKGEGA